MSRSESNAGRRITLHMVSSLDGFIAKKDNSVSWLDSPGSVYEAGVSISKEQVTNFVKTIDCYVLGSRTYAHALELGWPYGETPVVVVTGREWPQARKSVEFYSGDLKRLVDVKLAPRYRNIWLVGGAMLCHEFLTLGLVDEIKLTIAPVTVGRRTPAVRRSPDGGEVEFEGRGRLQERFCGAIVYRPYRVRGF